MLTTVQVIHYYNDERDRVVTVSSPRSVHRVFVTESYKV